MHAGGPLKIQMNKPGVNHTTEEGWLQLGRSKAEAREGSQWDRAQTQPQASETQRETPAAHMVGEAEGLPQSVGTGPPGSTSFPAQQG